MFDKLEKYYHTIEMDASVSKQEMERHMTEWNAQTSTILLEQNLTNDRLRKMVDMAQVNLRPGWHQLVNTIYDHHQRSGIVVFSAGCKNVIDIVLENEHDGIIGAEIIRTIGNELIFTDGVGSRWELSVKPSTKFTNRTAIEYFQAKKEDVKIAVAIGDMPTDREMLCCVPDGTIQISIGIWNEAYPPTSSKDKALLEKYMNIFDIVLHSMESMSLIEDLFFGA